MRPIKPTAEDMLGTLPPGDAAELLTLIGTAGTGETAGHDSQPGDCQPG